MVFFFCPRWLPWSRLSSTAPETSQSHPLDTIVELSASEQLPEGMTRPTRHQRNTSGGLSHKIRKRFSHESPRLRTHTSIFGVASRLTHRPNASNDTGSSLMSEKCYDSDAQYITTPKKVAEYPSIGSRIWGRVSPLGESLYEPIRDDPCDEPPEITGQSRPAEGTRFIEHGDIEIPRFEWQAPECIDSEPTQRWLGSPKPVYPPGYSQDFRFRDPMSVIHEDHQPQPCNDAPTTTVATYHTEHDSQRNTFGNSVDSPSDNTLNPSLPCTNSADSVTTPYAELSLRKKRQRYTEERQQGHLSVHLGDIDISRALASTPTSPRFLSPDPSQDGSDESTVSNASRRFSHPVGSFEQLSWHPAELHLGPPRVASSIYSRPTSLSSGPCKYWFESRIFNHLYHNPEDEIAGYSSTLETNVNSCKPDDMLNATRLSSQASATQGILDHESLEESKRAPSGVSDPQSNTSSTRKVSIGWMTGGRRVGYGYTLIAGDDEVFHSPEGTAEPPAPSNPDSAAEPDNAGGIDDRADTNPKSTEKAPRTSKSVFGIFKVSHHFNPRHSSSKDTVKNDCSKKASGNSVAAFLFRAPTARKQAQNIELSTTEAKAQQSDPGNRDHTLVNTGDSQNGAHSHVANARRFARGQSLRRAKTLWTRRSVGSRSADTQSESTTPSSPGPSPPLLQRSKTQVMKRRSPSRRTPLLSDCNDENTPMVTEKPTPRMSQEAKEHHLPLAFKGDPQRRLHRSSSSNSEDGLFETY